MTWTARPHRRGGRQLALHRNRFPRERAGIWDLRWLPVCSSTEISLAEWLRDSPDLMRPRAVLARRQRRGVGQRGRHWQSPSGGVWLSAAMPWSGQSVPAAGLFGLALALELAQRLERHGVPVRIKWPNDLLVEGRKLAGVLPRLVHRGTQLRLVRCGIGLNVSNAVPTGAIALREWVPPAEASVDVWAAELLLALECSLNLVAGSSPWLQRVEDRLWSDQILSSDKGPPWSIEGLSSRGGLQLQRGQQRTEWIRWP